MIRRIPAILTTLTLGASLASIAHSADLKLPRPSQKADLFQTIGVTDIKLTYSRPGVKGRVIWGDLVPYDKVWRTGANEATTISFSTDVSVGGQPLAAGTYSLHTIPTPASWTIIFNRNADLWGSYSYNDSLDALRIQVAPRPHEMTEWMSFSFPEISVEQATLALDWEKLRLPIPITVKTIEVGLASAREAMASLAADDSRTAYRAADFAFNNNVAMEEAMTWVDKSIAIKADWLNLRLKANLLAKQGKTKEAIEVGERAITVARESAPPEEVTKLEKTVAEWKTKS